MIGMEGGTPLNPMRDDIRALDSQVAKINAILDEIKVENEETKKTIRGLICRIEQISSNRMEILETSAREILLLADRIAILERIIRTGK